VSPRPPAVPYAIAAALDLRPDKRPPFARWRFGVRAGFRVGLGYATLQSIYLVVTRGQWPATGRFPALSLALTDFVGFPVLLGVVGLLLPLMATRRSAAALGLIVGSLAGITLSLVEGGFAYVFEPVTFVLAALGAFFVTAFLVLLREAIIERWRPPGHIAKHAA